MTADTPSAAAPLAEAVKWARDAAEFRNWFNAKDAAYLRALADAAERPATPAPEPSGLADRLEALAADCSDAGDAAKGFNHHDDADHLWKCAAALTEAADALRAPGWTAGAEAMREAAAKACEPLGDPPCDCAYETTCNGEPCWIYDCHCSNSGDLTRIASWCSDKSRAAAIRASGQREEGEV